MKICKVLLLIAILFSFKGINAQNNEVLCPTPPMGWISWNLFEGNISESIVR